MLYINDMTDKSILDDYYFCVISKFCPAPQLDIIKYLPTISVLYNSKCVYNYYRFIVTNLFYTFLLLLLLFYRYFDFIITISNYLYLNNYII